MGRSHTPDPRVPSWTGIIRAIAGTHEGTWEDRASCFMLGR